MAKQKKIRARPGRNDPLTTVEQVIHLLGGVGVVARLTNRGATAVHNWRARRMFPATFYVMMSRELQQLGFEADPKLWGQQQLDMAA